MSVKKAQSIPAAINLLFATLICIYAAGRVLQLYADRMPMSGIVSLHVLPPAIFAIVHGGIRYGYRGITEFVALCLFVGGVFEIVGISTGIPYGSYYFTNVMGAKLFGIPILLALAYVGMGYLSWVLGVILLERPRVSWRGIEVVRLPLLATVIMVSWDVCMDPIWSTIEHAWVWRRGGAYFGVPVSNFLGWFLAVYAIYQLFALYLRGRPLPDSLPVTYWRTAVLFYAVSGAGNLLLVLRPKESPIVVDPAGVAWTVKTITRACFALSLVTMGSFALLAWMSIGRDYRPSPKVRQKQ